jgi:hypothetical protein
LFDSYRQPLRQEVARELAGDPRLAARFTAADPMHRLQWEVVFGIVGSCPPAPRSWSAWTEARGG